jgi:hypothetical protein
MPFLEGFNQAFFPVLLQHLDEQKRKREQEEALNSFLGGLNVSENVQIPNIQAPAQQGIMSGGRQLSPNLPSQSLPQPSFEQKTQIGLDDPRAFNPMLNYLRESGQDIGLPQIMALFQAQQPKTQFINQEYGGVDVGKIYPSGRATVDRVIPPDAELRQNAQSVRENPNQWLADSMNPNTSPQSRQLAKQKYDSYVKNQGTIAGERAEASHPFSLQDRQIKSYVGKDNLTRIIWQKPSGQTYETLSQDESATSEMRNKQDARALVQNSITEIEKLSKKVITEKTGIAQKAKATGRSVEAFLANDPDWLTYQAARMALAGNLAVAQQGSRPSDADIKAIWLPLVPNTFVDTEASSTQKWALIKVMSLPEKQGAGVPVDQDFDKMTDEQLLEYINKK